MPATSLRFPVAALLACSTVWATAPEAAAQRPRCAPGRAGCYLAPDGSWRQARADYATLHATRSPDHLRTAVEMALFVGGGTVWYWLDRDRNALDWDYDSWGERLTLDAFRYDNNAFDVNFVWHPVAGGAYHAFARGNDLGLLGASLWGFAASATWEFLIEFKEKISINDVLVTTGAGIPIGEFFHELGRHLRTAPDWLRWSLGFPTAFHDVLDGRHAPADDAPRSWHRFRLAYDIASLRADDGDAVTVHGLAFHGSLVAIPGHLRAGTSERVFADADFVTLRAHAGAGGGTSLDMLADTTLLGWYRQSIRPGTGGLHGESVGAGTSLAFLYRVEDHGGWEDRLSVLGFPGLALDVHVLSGTTRLSLTGRLHGTFAGVHAPGFEAWEAAHADQTAKSILRKQGYYYGWGGWARLEAELTVGPLAWSGAVSWTTADSHEGLDRTQERVTADLDVEDTALDYETRLRLTPFPRLGAYLELALTGRTRTSNLAGIHTERHLRRSGVAVGLEF